MKARNTLLAAAMVVAAGSVGIGATPAWAEPSGCDHDVDFWVSARPNNTYLMETDSEGWCNTSANRTLRVEIKYDGWPSDPVVASSSNNATSTSYYAYTATCDGGQTKEYYGRAFFTSSPTYEDEGPYEVHTCV